MKKSGVLKKLKKTTRKKLPSSCNLCENEFISVKIAKQHEKRYHIIMEQGNFNFFNSVMMKYKENKIV